MQQTNGVKTAKELGYQPISAMTDTQRKKHYRFLIRKTARAFAERIAGYSLQFKGINFNEDGVVAIFDKLEKVENKVKPAATITIETSYFNPLPIYNGTKESFDSLSLEQIRAIKRADFEGALKDMVIDEAELGDFDKKLSTTLKVDKVYKVNKIEPANVLAFWDGSYYLSDRKFYLTIEEA